MTHPLLMVDADTGYNLTRSLRFRASASAYLSRTPASAGNQQKFTISFRMKYSCLTSDNMLLSFGASTTFYMMFLNGGNQIGIGTQQIGVGNAWGGTIAPLIRDPASWDHFVIAIDTTQATAANRTMLYINGVNYAFSGTAPSQNYNAIQNPTTLWRIGSRVDGAQYTDGYMTEFNYVDGQALTPSSFGSTNATTGVWQPAKYTGTYGTNGFYLPFTDNSALTTSSNVGLGKDFSGNGNYWTTNNISITSGVTYDSMTDVPTLTSATAANFAVLNPLSNPNVALFFLSDGNLSYGCNSSAGNAPRMSVLSSIAMPSGKWYWEVKESTFSNSVLGITSGLVTGGTGLGSQYVVIANGSTGASSATYSGTTPTFVSGDVMGFAFDKGALTLAIYKNGTLLGTFSGIESAVANWFTLGGANTGASATYAYWNFGQRPFAYTPPSGFVALNAYNITEGSITTSGSFVGNVNADGPSIYLNGVPTAMTINGNAVTFGTHADKTAYGFKLRSSSTSYNSTGTNTYSITTTGAKFKYANAQGNP